MSKSISDAISEFQSQIVSLEEEIRKKQETVNTLCDIAGMAPLYEITSSASPKIASSFRSDEFYNKPLAAAVGKILESRKSRGLSAASSDEIYNVMIAGGFKFDSKNDAYAKRSMVIALSKNPKKFHRLPNGDWGLSEWYGVRGKNKSNIEKNSPHGGGHKITADDEVSDSSDG